MSDLEEALAEASAYYGDHPDWFIVPILAAARAYQAGEQVWWCEVHYSVALFLGPDGTPAPSELYQPESCPGRYWYAAVLNDGDECRLVKARIVIEEATE